MLWRETITVGWVDTAQPNLPLQVGYLPGTVENYPGSIYQHRAIGVQSVPLQATEQTEQAIAER